MMSSSVASAGSPAFTLPDQNEVRDIARAWEVFMTGQDKGLDKVRPVIRESWQRCQRLGVDPYLQEIPLVLSAEDLEALQERADLLEVAVPLFETILKAWEKERFLIGFSDRCGHILHITGHPSLLEQAREVNAVPGGGTAEAHIGTATANIVLAQGRADYVAWSEHYCQKFHSWAAVGAPIHHPFINETIGVIIAGSYNLSHPRALEIIEHIAARIGQLLHHEELVRRVTVLDHYHRFLLQHPQDTVLAVDARGHVCGASQSITQLLDAPQQLLGQSLLRVPDLRIEGFRSLTRQPDLQPYAVRVIAPKKEFSVHATAIPVRGARQLAGTILLLPHLSTPRLVRQSSSSWRATYTFADLVGHATPFRNCLTQARRAADGAFPVLLSGETGTGKELLAQAIHTASARRSGPFVAVNCGTASEELLAAELFGYVEGAFTGAVKGGKKGKFELAHGGTLFLDEIEEMPQKMQVSLLRVLEEHQLTRVGAERPVAVEVRVIAASNEDVQVAVRQKRFRLDLYHRLSAFPITLPPLRERTEDIPALVRHLLDQLGFPHLQAASETLAFLCRYSWPGNVRELRNVLLRAASRTTETVITPEALPPEVATAAAEHTTRPASSLRTSEHTLIRQALAETGGNTAEAAARLGIHRATLYRKLKRYGLS
jgi:transcriptional regulator of acetoin/glycerol metabolism